MKRTSCSWIRRGWRGKVDILVGWGVRLSVRGCILPTNSRSFSRSFQKPRKCYYLGRCEPRPPWSALLLYPQEPKEHVVSKAPGGATLRPRDTLKFK
jgi:hypothetical protein